MNLLFVNLPPTGLHESQTACARLPAAKQKGRLIQAAFVKSFGYFGRSWVVDDGCKGAGQFVGANPLTHGDEQFVCCSIVCGSAAEGDSPEVIEDDLPPALVSYRAHELPGDGSNPLMVPSTELFETSSVLLSGPKLLGARATPQA